MLLCALRRLRLPSQIPVSVWGPATHSKQTLIIDWIDCENTLCNPAAKIYTAISTSADSSYEFTYDWIWTFPILALNLRLIKYNFTRKLWQTSLIDGSFMSTSFCRNCLFLLIVQWRYQIKIQRQKSESCLLSDINW